MRQHAETSRLLGVGFVPCYRRGAGGAGATGEVEMKPGGAGPLLVDEEAASATLLDRGVPSAAADPAGMSLAEAVAAAGPDAAARLEALRARYIADAPHRHFCPEFNEIVFGEGDPSARLMFIGEAPGADEDRTGRPFVGRAGQLLDKMIVAMGLSRESVYIANVLKTRPPNNATPTVEEARLCAPYLFEQIRVVSPEVIVTLGKSATQLLLGTGDAMSRLRGRWAEFPPREPLVSVSGFEPIPVMPTFHPAYLLRSYTDENRAAVWSDLQQVMDRLGLAGRGR